MINKNCKIFVAGHKGLVGSAIIRKLKTSGYKKILTAEKSTLNLINQEKVLKFLKKKKPDFIFIAAAKVGGIYANNKYKADFIYSNLSIQNNLIHSAFKCGIKKFAKSIGLLHQPLLGLANIIATFVDISKSSPSGTVLTFILFNISSSISSFSIN